MDPVTLIVAALATGAASGASKTASTAVADAYAGLKTLVKNRFAGNSKAEEALADHESDPDTYEKPLAKQIQATGAEQDDEILRGAQKLLEEANATGVPVKYTVTVNGGTIGIIGDHGHVEN